MTGRRISMVTGATLLLSALLVGIALAQESFLDGKVRISDEVIVNDDFSGNIYLFGGRITINGTVDGDATAVAGQVTVNGVVTGDVLATAGSVTISGDVAGDVRTAAGLTVIEGAVSGDVVSSSGRLQIRAGSSIGQDLIFTTGQTIMNGTVDGGVVGSTGDYSAAGAVSGTQDVTVAEGPEEDDLGDQVLPSLSRFIGVVLVAALVVWLFPGTIDRTAAAATDRPLPSLGWGAVGSVAIVAFFIGTVMLSVLATLLFGLLRLGSLIALTWSSVITGWVVAGYGVYVLAAFVAPILMGAVAGYLIIRRERHSWASRVGAVSAGLVIVVVLTSLGVVGGLIGLLFFLVALGAIFVAVRDRRRALRAGHETQEDSEPGATAEA